MKSFSHESVKGTQLMAGIIYSSVLMLSSKNHISDLQQHNMNYPTLSLKQDLIDAAFSGATYGFQKQQEKSLSPGAIRMKKYRIQKELRLQSGEMDECDQCGFKTAKYEAMYRHKREKHMGLEKKCTDCDYTNIYPNRMTKHFNQVHRGIKRKNFEKCRRESCEYAGTTNCLELESHSLFICQKCQLSFERSDSFKFHNEKIHEGVIFKCSYCEKYLTARKNSLERHVISKHSENEDKRQKQGTIKFCKEEGCSFKSAYGELKQHMERKHEGIVRFKCHVMNCTFGSSQHKDLRRHAKTHEKESLKIELNDKTHEKESLTCDQEECNVKVSRDA